MRQRVGGAQPAKGRQHGKRALRQRTLGLRPRLDEARAGNERVERERVLLHRQHRHPVGRVVAQREPAVERAHRVGEGTAAGHDDHASRRGHLPERGKHPAEGVEVGEQPAPHLHHDLDACMSRAHRPPPTADRSSSSATAAAGAQRAASAPNESARRSTAMPACAAARAAMKSPSPVTTAVVREG